MASKKDPVYAFLTSPFRGRKLRPKIKKELKATEKNIKRTKKFLFGTTTTTKKRKSSKKPIMYAPYPCHRCGKKIRQGQAIVALGNYWHKACWKKEQNRKIKVTNVQGQTSRVKIPH